MKSKRILIGALLMVSSFAFLTGCKGKIQNSAAPQQSEVGQSASPDVAWGLELNQGEKWTVDPPMLSHIKNMETAVIGFSTESDRDSRALGERLQQDLEELISKCTMEGKSHEELHKWLLPFMNMVAEISETEDPEEADKIVADIKSALEIFHQYFK